jgi:hypothetical protein
MVFTLFSQLQKYLKMELKTAVVKMFSNLLILQTTTSTGTIVLSKSFQCP